MSRGTVKFNVTVDNCCTSLRQYLWLFKNTQHISLTKGTDIFRASLPLNLVYCHLAVDHLSLLYALWFMDKIQSNCLLCQTISQSIFFLPPLLGGITFLELGLSVASITVTAFSEVSLLQILFFQVGISQSTTWEGRNLLRIEATRIMKRGPSTPILRF